MPPGQAVVRPSLGINPKTDGLVLDYNTGDPVNGIIYDLSSTGGNGTIIGCPSVELTPMGLGMRFDGIKDRINCYPIAPSTVSVEFWFKPFEFPDNVTRFYDYYTDSRGHAFRIISSGSAELLLNNGGYIAIPAGYIFGLNRWYHVVYVHVNNAYQRVYVNGVLTASANNAVALAYVGTYRLMGDVNGDNTRFAHGHMITPRTYNRELSESEIRTHYAQAKTAMWATRHSDISVSPSDRGGVVGAFLEETPLQFGDTVGRWRIETAQIGGAQNCKIVRNYTALGSLYVKSSVFQQNQTEAAYGTWEVLMYTPAGGSAVLCMPIASYPGDFSNALQNGYILDYNSATLRIYLGRITAGAFATLCQSPQIYAADAWYKIRMTRQTNNSFTMYVNDQLMPVDFGTNPIVDTNFITSTYITFQSLTAIGGRWAYSCQSGNLSVLKGVTA